MFFRYVFGYARGTSVAKWLISVSAFVVCLHMTPGQVAVADTGRGGGIMVAEGTEQEQRLRDDCFSLIRNFDQTRTSNTEAIRLREAAEQNCVRASDPDVYRGWDQIRQALQMINAY